MHTQRWTHPNTGTGTWNSGTNRRKWIVCGTRLHATTHTARVECCVGCRCIRQNFCAFVYGGQCSQSHTKRANNKSKNWNNCVHFCKVSIFLYQFLLLRFINIWGEVMDINKMLWSSGDVTFDCDKCSLLVIMIFIMLDYRLTCAVQSPIAM